MTTTKMIEYAQRLKDSQAEIEIMSNVIICNLLNAIRENISSLYTLCEYVAELDMIQSLAQSSSIPNYVKPKFSTYLELKNARHPMLENLCQNEPVGNDTHATIHHNFHLITGPNMSGKSIYIRQIALLQIMAQVGSYIPAEEGYFRITNRIFSRIGFEDSIECDASTFQLDIREMQTIINSITGNSIVIIDELCRGTRYDEGTAIAWALCEKLINTTAFIFFTTHLHVLTKLENMYFNVKNWNMESIILERTKGERLQHTYHLKSGVTAVHRYGISTARASALPNSVIEKAMQYIENLAHLDKSIDENDSKEISKDQLTYNLIAELKLLKQKNKITDNNLKDLINSFKIKIQLLTQNNIIPLSHNNLPSSEQISICTENNLNISPKELDTHGTVSNTLDLINNTAKVDILKETVSKNIMKIKQMLIYVKT